MYPSLKPIASSSIILSEHHIHPELHVRLASTPSTASRRSLAMSFQRIGFESMQRRPGISFLHQIANRRRFSSSSFVPLCFGKFSLLARFFSRVSGGLEMSLRRCLQVFPRRFVRLIVCCEPTVYCTLPSSTPS